MSLNDYYDKHGDEFWNDFSGDKKVETRDFCVKCMAITLHIWNINKNEIECLICKGEKNDNKYSVDDELKQEL